MCPKKQQRVTKQKQDKMLERFYAEFEIETDKTVVLGEFIGDSKDVDFNHAESTLYKNEENEVAAVDDNADDNPPVAGNTNATQEEWRYSSFGMQTEIWDYDSCSWRIEVCQKDHAENHGNHGKFHKSYQILNQTKRYINKLCLGKISRYKTVRIKFSVDSEFSNKPYDKKRKTRKSRKSTQSFPNQKAPIVNGVPLIENC